MSEFEIYQSPFSWRYASPEMRFIWSERNKRLLWRKIWVALAETQAEFGLVTSEQVDDLRQNAAEVDIPRALEIEAEIHHDLMAELHVFASQCRLGGGIIHLGATSMDIEDNADAIRLVQALDLILQSLRSLLEIFAVKIEQYAQLTTMAFTHLQPAEPTTLGYRLAFYAQDLLEDYLALQNVRGQMRGKGFKGAVGTGAAYAELLGLENFEKFEKLLSQKLDLRFFHTTSQTYPRRQDYTVISALAGTGAVIYKFAFDLRFLQSPPLGEWSEPFGKKQVGSSAMPFKRNPVQAEKIDSLARLLAAMPQVAWHNAAHSLLERTLDDSANRRSLLPESFLILDELIKVSRRILKDLVVNEQAIKRNLEVYAPFAATEKVLMAAARGGGNRQELHERLRSHAMLAWQAVQAGASNPLLDYLLEDPVLTGILPAGEIRDLMAVDEYTGIAAERAVKLAVRIRKEIQPGLVTGEETQSP